MLFTGTSISTSALSLLALPVTTITKAGSSTLSLGTCKRSRYDCLATKAGSSTLSLDRKQMQVKSFGARHSCQKQMVPQLMSLARWSLTHTVREKHASVICAAALNARCAAEQTQTVTRESSTITVAPTLGKEKSPELDDGGDGFPPRDDGDGGGGGGGGGGHWAGGFFFFGFLALLGFLQDKEAEGDYDDNRRKKNYSR